MSMQNIGSLLPNKLLNSHHESLKQLGQRIDLFDSFETGFEWLMDYTHAIFDSAPYLANIIHLFNKTDDTYYISDKVCIFLILYK